MKSWMDFFRARRPRNGGLFQIPGPKVPFSFGAVLGFVSRPQREKGPYGFLDRIV